MQMEAAAARAPVGWQQDFEAVCREYEQAVKRTGRLDFDDMLYNCKQLLRENEKIREYWQNRFRYILIDEFQDINPVQYEAVKLLAASPYNIFAVGDPARMSEALPDRIRGQAAAAGHELPK